MTAAVLADLTSTLSHRARIGAEDVLALRRLVWADALVARDEADALMALNIACSVQSREWIDYFVEVMTDYIVQQQEPRGYVDQGKAQWLMKWVDRDGHVDSRSGLELLVKVLETATSVPGTLRVYVLQQIEAAILTGSGPTRREHKDGDGTLDAKCINATEVDLLKRVIYADAGMDGWIVSTEEADMLFRLKDATLGAKNADEWPSLFVHAVANHLMAHRNYDTLSRQDQMRIDTYASDTDIRIGRFFRRMLGLEKAALPDSILRIPDTIADEQAQETARVLTPAEIRWTISQIREDGRYDPMEKALVAFLRNEGVVAPSPSL